MLATGCGPTAQCPGPLGCGASRRRSGGRLHHFTANEACRAANLALCFTQPFPARAARSVETTSVHGFCPVIFRRLGRHSLRIGRD